MYRSRVLWTCWQQDDPEHETEEIKGEYDISGSLLPSDARTVVGALRRAACCFVEQRLSCDVRVFFFTEVCVCVDGCA